MGLIFDPTPQNIQRFWDRVDRKEPQVCWLWKGNHNKLGYGLLTVTDSRISSGRRDRLMRAHRISWELHNKPLRDDECVCHRCDNPPCVNPGHLFVGSIADNNADMRNKGRNFVPEAGSMFGEEHVFAKLTDDKVIDLRQRLLAGASVTRIAKELGVCASVVSEAARGITWKHLNEKAPPVPKRRG